MLSNLPVRAKLIAILALPVLVMIVLVVSRVGGNVADSRRLDRLAGITRVSSSALTLVHDLQRERDLSVAQSAGAQIFDGSALPAARARTDASRRAFETGVAGLDLASTRETLREQLGIAQRRLAQDLGAERVAVDKRARSAPATIGFYTSTIETLLNFTAEVPAESDAVQFARDLNAGVAFARAKEAAAFERSFVLALLTDKVRPAQPDQGDVEQLVSTIGAGKVWLAQFNSLATDSQRRFLTDATAGPDSAADSRLRRTLVNESGQISGEAKPLNWMAAMNGVVDRFRGAEQGLGQQVLREISATQAEGNRRAFWSSLAILSVLLLSVVISLFMSQSMVGALGRLRQNARDIAEHRLPAAVERLRRMEESDSVEFDSTRVPPPAVRSADEIGEVAGAFGAVQTVAVRVATEQAALRKSVGDMFLNFARRSQTLIDRQLELIHELGTTAGDPVKREEFSRLDHLATRMRRNAEDLIVLSGAKAPRRWSEPVKLVDVLSVALAEVEDYKRVELVKLDDLGIAGHAVSDVAHLLAELIENATSFSPPSTAVHIAGQTVTNGYVIEIEDQGIGMTDGELVEANERLANPAEVDLTLSSRLGLFVVGRLADRYGIKVQLRHSWYDGVAALVLLPDQLVTLPSELPPPRSGGQATGPQRAALPPRRSAPAPAAAPAAASRPGRVATAPGEPRLPIFEQTRSDWFRTGPRPATPPRPEPDPPQRPEPAVTGTGLPRRVPRSSLAPALAGEPPPGDGPPPAPGRSPETVRRTLSDYRSGFERGRHEASSSTTPDPTVPGS
jgi:signal transduction histidine kinase